MTVTDEIRLLLSDHAEAGYAAFQRKLLPTLPPESVLGIRTPALRAYAKALLSRPDIGDFLAELPHGTFEENQLHAFLLSLERDYDRAVAGVEAFLPYVDNWATCDQLSPKVFRRHLPELLPHIRTWLASAHPYTCRFGIGMLMEHYLGDAFTPEYLQWVAALRSEEYYVNMMIAWYFATALAKQYEAALPYLKERRMDRRVHSKTIQKAVESRRVTEERKAYLRALRY